MHYKNGREAKAGDTVVHLPGCGAPKTGVIHDISAGSDFCNARLSPISDNDYCVSVKDCLHIDDVKAVGNHPVTARVRSLQP